MDYEAILIAFCEAVTAWTTLETTRIRAMSLEQQKLYLAPDVQAKVGFSEFLKNGQEFFAKAQAQLQPAKAQVKPA